MADPEALEEYDTALRALADALDTQAAARSGEERAQADADVEAARARAERARVGFNFRSWQG